MKKQYQITLEGKQELEIELEELKSKRGEIAEKIAAARELGDLSENADYDAARDEQGQAETRIAEIEDILLKSGGKKVSYKIVGPVEADPLEAKISNESPLGSALIGQKAGDSVEIETPKGKTKYTIEKIA